MRLAAASTRVGASRLGQRALRANAVSVSKLAVRRPPRRAGCAGRRRGREAHEGGGREQEMIQQETRWG